MIAVDPSAIVSILLQEEDASFYAKALMEADEKFLSAASFVELNVVMWRRLAERGTAIVDQIVAEGAISIVPLSAHQAILARNAYNRYPVLNFGDAFSYALAKDLDAPLLFKGEDFVQTDIARA